MIRPVWPIQPRELGLRWSTDGHNHNHDHNDFRSRAKRSPATSSAGTTSATWFST